MYQSNLSRGPPAAAIGGGNLPVGHHQPDQGIFDGSLLNIGCCDGPALMRIRSRRALILIKSILRRNSVPLVAITRVSALLSSFRIAACAESVKLSVVSSNTWSQFADSLSSASIAPSNIAMD